MFFADYGLVRSVMQERQEAGLATAEERRWLRQAGLSRSTWMTRQSSRLLFNLGHRLVALGRRLERYQIEYQKEQRPARRISSNG